MNTEIQYLYTDANNYKNINHVVVSGEITNDQIERIINACDRSDCNRFIPRQIGLPEERITGYPLNEADHCWFEIEKDDFNPTDKEPTINMSVDELVEAFENVGFDGWDDVSYAVMYDEDGNNLLEGAEGHYDID